MIQSLAAFTEVTLNNMSAEEKLGYMIDDPDPTIRSVARSRLRALERKVASTEQENTQLESRLGQARKDLNALTKQSRRLISLAKGERKGLDAAIEGLTEIVIEIEAEGEI